MEVHYSIGLVKLYHAVLRPEYKVIMEYLQGIINKETTFQIEVKAVNNTAGPNGLIPTLLVFGAYSQIYGIEPPVPTIIQRAAAIEKAMEQFRKIRAKKQVIDTFKTKNRSLLNLVHDLLSILMYKYGKKVM